MCVCLILLKCFASFIRFASRHFLMHKESNETNVIGKIAYSVVSKNASRKVGI